MKHLISHTSDQNDLLAKGLPAFKDLVALTKPKIGVMTLVVSLGSLALAPGSISFMYAAATLTGIILLVSGASSLNMYLERDIDGLMARTQDRPLPSGRVHPTWALLVGMACLLTGLQLLFTFGNPITLFLGVLAAFFYVLVYTPMKTASWWSLPVGAIPGAMPGLLGYSAVTGTLDGPAWVLFFVLWSWQIPHTLAIWVYRQKEYENAGYAILSSQASSETMVWAITGTSFAYILGTGLIWGVGFGGVIFALVNLLCGIWYMAVVTGVKEHKTLNQWARRVFLGTLVHQTVIFLVLALDVGLHAMLPG
ncbi:MAG: protoheme IX farnesyltransferase [Myxococcales bacterium]|nr:protoheme IX farnesyltransferase [Myxococcales bacterium]